MFREMRRKDKLKSQNEAIEILKICTHGVLSVIGDNGYPYGVPISYVYSDGKLLMHCATEGHKLDAVKNEPKVSFTVVATDNVKPDKYTTVYSSVVCFGNARIVDDYKDKNIALEHIIDKYSSSYKAGGMEYIKKTFDKCKVIVIDIEHMTGKGQA